MGATRNICRGRVPPRCPDVRPRARRPSTLLLSRRWRNEVNRGHRPGEASDQCDQASGESGISRFLRVDVPPVSVGVTPQRSNDTSFAVQRFRSSVVRNSDVPSILQPLSDQFPPPPLSEKKEKKINVLRESGRKRRGCRLLDHEIVPRQRRATHEDLYAAGVVNCKRSLFPSVRSDDAIVRYLTIFVFAYCQNKYICIHIFIYPSTKMLSDLVPSDIMRIDRPHGSQYFRRVIG